MTIVLAGLDIATVTGIGLMVDKKITTQTFRAEGKKRFLDDPNDKSLDAKRMGVAGRSFEDFLEAFLITNGVQHVAIEEPLNMDLFGPRKKLVGMDANALFGQGKQFEVQRGRSLASSFKIYGLEFIACTVCARLNIPSTFVNQTTWRKAFLGNGRPKDAKHEAKAMCAKFGIECSSLDAAEAAGIVFWLGQYLNPYGLQRANDLFKESTGS